MFRNLNISYKTKMSKVTSPWRNISRLQRPLATKSDLHICSIVDNSSQFSLDTVKADEHRPFFGHLFFIF